MSVRTELLHQKHWGQSGQLSSRTVIVWCFALAVSLALPAQAAALDPVSGLGSSSAPSRRGSADSSQDEPWQCVADLSAPHAKQSTLAETLSAPSKALLTSQQEIPAARGFFGQNGKPGRHLAQAAVPGAYSPVATSTLPTVAGNLLPSTSGYFQTASPYASPSTSSSSLFLLNPTPPQAFISPPASVNASSSPVSTSPVAASASAVATLQATASPVPASTAAAVLPAAAVISPAAFTTTPISTTYSPSVASTPPAITISSPISSPLSPGNTPVSPAAVTVPAPASSVTPSTASPAPVSPTSAALSSSIPVRGTPSDGISPAASAPASPANSALPVVAPLNFPDIPLGNEPFISFQAVFEQIPLDSLTVAEVAEVASSLSQAIATYVGNTTTVTTAIVPINAVAYAAHSSSGTRRHLMQATGNTLQATLAFTLTFAVGPTQGNAAVQSAVQAAVASAVTSLTVMTTAVNVGPGAYNVTVDFPPNNQVSNSASQGTLAGTTFLAALRANSATALPGLSTTIGTFSLTSSQLNVALVTAAPGADATPAATVTATIPSDSSLTTPELSSVTTTTSPAAIPSAPAAAAPAIAPGSSSAAAVLSSPADASPVSPALVPTDSPDTTPAQATTVLVPSSGASALPSPPLSPPSLPPPSQFRQASLTATFPAAATPVVSPPSSAPAPVSPATSVSLIYNVSVTFPPFAIASAQDLANTLVQQSDKALYAVVAADGEVNIINVVYGSQVSYVAPGPGPGPATLPAAAPEAAAAPQADIGAAIESYTAPDVGTSSNTNASGQLYAINMQYGVTGASTSSSANLLVLSLPVSPGAAPQPTDFTVLLEQASQTGNVSVLSNYATDADFLLRVDSPRTYAGKVTVKYASASASSISYNVVQSLLLVKVTASSTT